MRKAKTNKNNDTWFLQGDDGTVYGPVDTTTLKTWCLEGRVEPDTALSRDRETWVDAASVGVLEMDWLARLGDDTLFGPFNLQIVPGLVENGILPPDAVLVNRHTGERRTASGRAVADDLFPEWTPNPAPRPSAPKAAPVDPAEQEPPAEVFQDEGWPADEPVDFGEADAPDSATDEEEIVTDEDWPGNNAPDDEEPHSGRLEPLQRSATEARQQLDETRYTLQTLRTAHTVLQDDNQRLKDELAAAIKARQQNEQQLLEQQDRAAAVETEVENLRAQLEQMKNHYDRLQRENQSQFEKIDSLQASQLQIDQRYKRELLALSDRADAKTELLAGTVQLLMRDGDLAGRLKSAPVAAAADDQTEPLRAAIRQLEQQLEHARQQARLQPQQPAPHAPRHPIAMLMLLAAGILLGAAVTSLGTKGCSRPDGNETPVRTTNPAGESSAPAGATEDREFVLQAEPLDLQPEVSPLPEALAEAPEEGTALAIQWPTLSLPAASIRPHGQTLRIVFNEGIFSVSTRLTPEAETALRSLAEQLQGKLNGHQLMIEGHTDATPIATGGSRYVDNFALGMARAEAVKTFLTQTGRIPAGAIRTSSAGESAPPFPNETDADRKRNRTAVLTLVAH